MVVGVWGVIEYLASFAICDEDPPALFFVDREVGAVNGMGLRYFTV